MKKKFMIGIMSCILMLTITACNSDSDTESMTTTTTQDTVLESQENTNSDSAEVNTVEESASTDTIVSTDTPTETLNWPEEFENWGVPIIPTATVTIADNRSSNGTMLTQGVNAIVNLSNVSEADFDNYCAELEATGYTKSPDSLDYVLVVYNKSIDGGEIEITLSYTEDVTTVVVNNSAAAANKDAAAGGAVEWPETLNDIPAFTKGSYKETVDMGGNMYAISFIGVTESDLDWYRSELMSNGFELQPSEDTEGYMKMSPSASYSVGFILEGDSLQIIAVYGTN